jgi:hypothetical protein
MSNVCYINTHTHEQLEINKTECKKRSHKTAHHVFFNASHITLLYWIYALPMPIYV